MNKKPTSLALSIIVLQFISWINIIIFVLLLGYFLYGFTIEPELAMMSATLTIKLFGAFGGLFLAILLHFIAKGLLMQKKWARVTTIILGIIMLFGFPVGTAVGILLIYGTTKGWPEKLYETTDKHEEAKGSK